MTAEHAHNVVPKAGLQRETHLTNRESEELPARKNFQQASMADLQRLMGNKGVQTLLAKGKLSVAAGVQTQRATAQRAAIQRSFTQGHEECEDCGEEHEEHEESHTTEFIVQRDGDDDENNTNTNGNDNSESSGSFWDRASNAVGEAADFVGNTANAAVEGASQIIGDTADQAASTVGEVVNGARDTANGVIDGAIGVVEQTFGSNDSPAQTNDMAATTETSGSGDTVTDADASCLTEEGVGFGSGTGVSVSLHGKTDANYDHGKPYPKAFPSSVTMKRYKIGKTDVFDASGTMDATYKANPKVNLPPVPSGLSACQIEAVKTFINGDLAAHEQDHADAFTNNYDGTASAAVSFKAIPAAKEAEAVQSAVEQEDVKRITAANQASAKLDPWKKTIPGLDCED